ncbi:MAG: OprD family outer membrane porin [Thermonemataceae bacterium]|nr:OprD family outer membrane porin [Thermonemataceae bacterium]
MKMIRFLFLLNFFLLNAVLYVEAQVAMDTITNIEPKKDTMRVLDYLAKGIWKARVRNYTMLTENANTNLSDYHANALGAAIYYKTATFKGFSFNFTGSFIYNTWSSDLGKPDSLTKQFNRYEIGLFDLDNPYQAFMGRIDEFNLQYAWKKSKIVFGKQILVTPMLNPQDGRMQPNSQEGVYIDFKEVKKLRIQAAWIYRFLTRSTENWLAIDESIGVYPSGVTPDGVRSRYLNNLRSSGLAFLGVEYKIAKGLNTQLWNYFVENIFSTSLLQTEVERAITEKQTLLAGVQGYYQIALNKGGNDDPKLSYIPENQKNWALSARLGWKNANTSVTLNYTHIADKGRFLFPREWGRDAFYTFLPRERNEGFGGVNAVMAQFSKNFRKLNLKAELSYGHYYLPDTKNAFLNKYGVPSYNQLNINFIHQFSGFLKGLQGQFLYVYKGKIGDTYNNPNYEFNKVEMSLYNIIFNYNF